MQALILQVVSGILGLWLASEFVDKVSFTDIKHLFLAGAILGFLNTFLKPFLNLVTLPLRLLTFGLFGLVINMSFVWLVDLVFPEVSLEGWMPLIKTSLIIWGLGIAISLLFPLAKKPFRK